MLSALLTALLLSQVPNTTATTVGAKRGQDVNVLNTVAISGTISTAGAADTVGATATYNANSVCGFVATAGQTGAGFIVQAGTLAATLTPSVSTDSTNGTNGTWTATSFVDISGNKSSTQVLTNPNSAAAFGLVLEAGVRYAKVCTTAYTSGSATGNLVASTPVPPPPAAGADVTDRAARVLGQLTDGASAITPAKTGQLPTALDGSGFLKVHEQGTATVSGTVTTSPPANASTNLTQVVGTAVDVNSGTKSAGTIRVVLATDQPQLTNPQLVTINDGTNTAKVQAASTGPALADKALTVAQSPNVSEQCPTVLAISQTASTDLKTSSAKLHICSIVLVSASAQSISLVEGTGSTCATGTAALVGATTAANGPALAANGGFTAVAGVPWLRTATTADHLCLLQSGSGNLSGVITLVDQ